MITRDDWIKALTEANVSTDNDQDAVTVREFASMTGLGSWMAGYYLRKLYAMGKATRTSKRGVDMGGRPRTLVAYRLIEPKAKRKTK